MANTYIEEYKGAQVNYDVKRSKFVATVGGAELAADSLASLRSLIRKQAEDTGEKEAKQTKQDAIRVYRTPVHSMWTAADTKDVQLGAFGKVPTWGGKAEVKVWVTPKTRTGRYYEKERERLSVEGYRGEFYKDTPENRARLQRIAELVAAHNAQAQTTSDRIAEVWAQMERVAPTIDRDSLPVWDR